ncbi:splicing factor, arginine/serine-rich 19-like [Oryctolagus cuniculus]|uniref:splicing factor, arginine/serine-rich 19-like n=1 Tax=Oryctolagus cuniculus TaxID=9986 RepID=UPI00387973F0
MPVGQSGRKQVPQCPLLSLKSGNNPVLDSTKKCGDFGEVTVPPESDVMNVAAKRQLWEHDKSSINKEMVTSIVENVEKSEFFVAVPLTFSWSLCPLTTLTEIREPREAHVWGWRGEGAGSAAKGQGPPTESRGGQRARPAEPRGARGEALSSACPGASRDRAEQERGRHLTRPLPETFNGAGRTARRHARPTRRDHQDRGGNRARGGCGRKRSWTPARRRRRTATPGLTAGAGKDAVFPRPGRLPQSPRRKERRPEGGGGSGKAKPKAGRCHLSSSLSTSGSRSRCPWPAPSTMGPNTLSMEQGKELLKQCGIPQRDEI